MFFFISNNQVNDKNKSMAYQPIQIIRFDWVFVQKKGFVRTLEYGLNFYFTQYLLQTKVRKCGLQGKQTHLFWYWLRFPLSENEHPIKRKYININMWKWKTTRYIHKRKEEFFFGGEETLLEIFVFRSPKTTKIKIKWKIEALKYY